MPSKTYLPGSDYPPPPPPVGGGEWPWARGRDPGRSGDLVDQQRHLDSVAVASNPFTRRRRKGWSDMHRQVTGGRAFLEAAAGTWAGFSVGRFIPSAYNTLRPGSPFAMYSINTAVQIAGGVVGAIGAASDSPYAAAFGAGMNWAGYVGKYSDTLAAAGRYFPRPTANPALPDVATPMSGAIGPAASEYAFPGYGTGGPLDRIADWLRIDAYPTVENFFGYVPPQSLPPWFPE